jgi:hypothetical protein
MHESRLGDEIDDFCIKCKRLTNHAIVSLLNGKAAKVRCRTCYHDHDFRNGEPMPSKKDLKKQQLFDQVLAGAGAPAVVAIDGTVVPPPPPPPEVVEGVEVVEPATAGAEVEIEAPPEPVAVAEEAPTKAAAAKKGRKTAKSAS